MMGLKKKLRSLEFQLNQIGEEVKEQCIKEIRERQEAEKNQFGDLSKEIPDDSTKS